MEALFLLTTATWPVKASLDMTVSCGGCKMQWNGGWREAQEEGDIVVQLCPTLCGPMDCSTPGFPVLHHLLEFAQTHVH